MTNDAKWTFAPRDLAAYHVSAARGFLPATDPLQRLSSRFGLLEYMASELPGLLAARSFGTKKNREHPILDVKQLKKYERERAFMLYMHLQSGWVWENHTEGIAAQSIPAWIAVPGCELALMLNRPPILAYASYALHNWKKLDPQKPIELDNISLLQHFLGGLDEEWFTLVHVEIEANAGSGIVAALRAQESAMQSDVLLVSAHLDLLVRSLKEVNATFARMPERCDPYIYYNRVRPWIHGWHNQPLLPNGVVYEGVERLAGTPLKLRGETGAQSSILPLFDAILGVKHEPDPLMSAHLAEMRAYMPYRHRNLIGSAEGWPPLRPYVIDHPQLKDVYNDCIEGIYAFSAKHLEYAALYIFNQAQKKAGANPTGIGTGGTPFMASLKKHANERLAARV